MRKFFFAMVIIAGLLCPAFVAAVAAKGESGSSPPLGLPLVPVPEANPQSPEKVALGEKLFNDKRFSSTGDVSCATCHAVEKAFRSAGPTPRA